MNSRKKASASWPQRSEPEAAIPSPIISFLLVPYETVPSARNNMASGALVTAGDFCRTQTTLLNKNYLVGELIFNTRALCYKQVICSPF